MLFRSQNNCTTTTTEDPTNDTQKRNTYHHVVNTIDHNINRTSPTNSITIPINSTANTTISVTATTTTTTITTTTTATTTNPNQYFNNMKTIDNNKENNYIEIPSPAPQQSHTKMLNGNGHLIGTTINNFTDLNDSSRRVQYENQKKGN